MKQLPGNTSFLAKVYRPFLHKVTLRADIIAGITVGLVLIPQSLAYAQLAGLPPHYGLYAALLPPFLAALFGSSAQLATGPVAVLSLLALSAVSPISPLGSNEYISNIVLLACLLGLFQILLGTLKLGGLVSFLSHPVIYAFTNAAALIIATTQLSAFFGISVPNQEHHYQTIIALFQKAITAIHWQTFILGCIAVAWMLILRKINRNIPYVLITVVVLSVIVQFLNYPVALVGTIPNGLPIIGIPRFDSGVLGHLIIPVITMSLIGFTESVSVAQAIALKTKERLDPNKELIGQGIANAVGSFSLSYPVSGSFSRTALNYQAGAKTWLSSFFTSFMVLITLLFFTPLLYYLPKVVLAAIIIISVSTLIDFSKIKPIISVSLYDGIAAILTFFGTLYFAPDLEKGLLLGIVFSIGHFVFRSTRPKVAFLSMYKDGFLHDYKLYNLDQCENIAVVRLDAPLFFANATFFENEIIRYLSQHPHVTHIIFSANGINEIDATGEELLAGFIETLRVTRKKIFFSTVKSQVVEIFKKTGLYEVIGAKNFYPTTLQALKSVLKQINESHKHMDDANCPLTKYIYVPVDELHYQRTRRERLAFVYNKLFH